MALSIKNPKAEELAKEVAQETGKTMTQAIIISLEEKLERVRGKRKSKDLVEKMMAISKRISALPDLDNRTPDEILGYNEKGTFD